MLANQFPENIHEDVRICDECGNDIYEGFMCNDGSWYCCETCMDKLIENKKMRETPDLDQDEENDMGGYYDEFIEGRWEPVSVFWTCWND